MNEIDHRYTRDVVCPHCGYVYHDCWEWPDEGDETCAECDKPFDFWRDVHVSWVTIKAKEEG